MISVTSKAIEQAMNIEKPPQHYLRISVAGGGCSGLQYMFSLDKKLEDDIVLESCVLIDPISSTYIDGSNIDFEESLSGSVFKIINPQVTGTCGCGESFAI